MLRRGYRVDGLDIAEKMVNLARENCRKAGVMHSVNFHMGDAEDLSFESNSFDLVIAVGLLGWLPQKHQALTEMFRVITPLLHYLEFEIPLSATHGFGLFRFLGRNMFPDKFNLKLHYFLQTLGDNRRLPYLHRLAARPRII